MAQVVRGATSIPKDINPRPVRVASSIPKKRSASTTRTSKVANPRPVRVATSLTKKRSTSTRTTKKDVNPRPVRVATSLTKKRSTSTRTTKKDVNPQTVRDVTSTCYPPAPKVNSEIVNVVCENTSNREGEENKMSIDSEQKLMT